MRAITCCLKKFFPYMTEQDVQEFLYAIYPFLFGIYPVSYTHLDVYKRQVFCCADVLRQAGRSTGICGAGCPGGAGLPMGCLLYTSLRFACYVAVCYTVYGASYDFLTTEHLLGLVSQLRPDMVKQLKTAGSGNLPKAIQRRKTEHFTASANDVFAAIRSTARDSTEECYAEILDYLCAVLEQEEFPRSYSVEFRGKLSLIHI